MSRSKKTLRAIPDTTLRRLRNTPSYFFLIWRWSMWLYAFIMIVWRQPAHYKVTGSPMPVNLVTLATLLLTVTFLQALIVTLYAPVFQAFLPNFSGMKKRSQPGQRTQRRIFWSSGSLQPPATEEATGPLAPLAHTRNPYWDTAIYGIDVLICGVVVYYSGIFGDPHYGIGSPFYRYGLSTVFAAALTYLYRGGLTAGLGYLLFTLLGAFFPPPGTPHLPLNGWDFEGPLLDIPVVAILVAYLATLIKNYARSKKEVQDNVRRQRALLHVGETIVREASDRQRLLQQSAEQIRQGGKFYRLVVAPVSCVAEEEESKGLLPQLDTCIEANIPDFALPDRDETLPERVMRSGKKLSRFEPLHEEDDEGYGIACLYLPLFKDGQVQMVLGAESRRHTPFDAKQEDFLTIAGAQLLVALENIRLTEQMIQLAATAERGRIAREIHDGVAQLVYMLSLNTETCAAQAHRIVEASEEDAELLTPLAGRLDKLVTISKQALWETRNYMFTLKPLMSGTATLTQMLTNQLREFQAISGLPAYLEVEGSEEMPNGDRRRARKHAQVGTAIFRITQEALTNAYKHAEATQIWVHLHHLPDSVEVEVRDDGRGLQSVRYNYDLSTEGERQRIYSGHGLRGMRERAEELGGTFEITQLPNGGVKVQAHIPI